MRVLVCGGRDFNDRNRAFEVLDAGHRKLGFTVVISGLARGADSLAVEWANQKGLPVMGFAAEWGVYGVSAGPKRNQRMLVEGKPEIVVAFPGGRGTADMVRRSEKAGVRVVKVPAKSGS